MAAHTFRGSTWRTWLRLEDERRAFERYCAIRERERDYLDDVTVRTAGGGGDRRDAIAVATPVS
jgi:hypothetical protein